MQNLTIFNNAQFAVGKSEDIIPMWIENGIIPDVIVVDPPRKGCDKNTFRYDVRSLNLNVSFTFHATHQH